jgi:glutathione S-transferase
VPVLLHEGRHLSESNVINEYLDEVYPEPALLPATPHARGRSRVWMDFANASLFPAFKLVHVGATGEVRARAWADLELALARLEAEARRARLGPYWFGSEATLLDFTLYPVFEHWTALAQHGLPALPATLTWTRRWLEQMAQRASVQAAANPTEFYARCYAQSPALRPPAPKWPAGELG